MRRSFRLYHHQSYSWLFFLTAALVGVCFYFVFSEEWQAPELLISLLGTIATFFYFLYAQHNSNTERFILLFKEFNARFDMLNDDLNRIHELPANTLKDSKDLQRLYDYFNLCAEEYLYYKAGYIDDEVWLAWSRGMAYFASNGAIRSIWERELKQGSYYGFTLSLLPVACGSVD